MALEIRPIEVRDNTAVKNLVQDTLVEFGLNRPGTAYFDPELSDLTGYYRQKKFAQYWVLTDGVRIFGGVGIYPINKSTCEVQKLYLIPELRGQGWGGKLLAGALSYAEAYYQFAYLDTRSELSDAIGLYKKFGFTELDAAPEHSAHNFMDHWFIKDLSLKK